MQTKPVPSLVGDTPEERRNTRLGIDFMRGGFALMVMLAHNFEVTCLRFGVDYERAGEARNPWNWLTATLGHGAFWVGGFFILSGLCIQWSVLGMLKRKSHSLKSYFLARVTRIYPLYLATLLFYLLILAGFGALGHAFKEPFELSQFVSHVFMLQGITGVISPLGPAWSLTYECFYYLLWPVLLVATSYRSNFAVVLGAILCVIGTVVLGAIWKIHLHGALDSYLMPASLILFGFLTWGAGVWLATNWHTVARQTERLPPALAIAGVVGAYLLQAYLTLKQSHQWVFLVVSVVSLPFWIILLAQTRHWRIPASLADFAGFCGRLSYPLYLLHRLFLEALDAITPSAHQGMFASPAGYMAYSFISVLAICVLVGVPLEIATFRWRERLLREG